jgi:hypothetical protein
MTERAGRGWIAGLVVGVAGGFLALEFPTLGWLAAAIGGLLTGIGACWLVLLGRVAITCQATGDELGCHAPGIEPWLAVGAGVLAIGLALTIVAFARARRRP